jgi:pimeloyl-ACP methyl ester carboxylesterase
MPRIGMLSKILMAALAVEAVPYAAAAYFISPRALVVCAFVALGWRLLTTINMFRTSERFRSERLPHEGLDRDGWTRLLRHEYWAMLRLYVLYHPFEWLLNRRGPVRPDASPPVLCVHGYVCNGGYWTGLKPVLAGAGFNNVYTINMDPTFGSIEDFARQVAARVETILRETGAEQVAIIGHSMGGLVARCYVQRHGGAERVSRIITLGTPHHGTVVAKGGPGIDARQMEPRSEWLAELNAEAPVPVPITSIWTAHDNIIAPQDSSVLPHAENIRLHGIGHLELAYSPAVQQHILKALRG